MALVQLCAAKNSTQQLATSADVAHTWSCCLLMSQRARRSVARGEQKWDLRLDVHATNRFPSEVQVCCTAKPFCGEGGTRPNLSTRRGIRPSVDTEFTAMTARRTLGKDDEP